MANYAELRTVMGDASYRNKIEAALVDQANVVLREQTSTTNHAERVRLAFLVLEQRQRFAEMFAQAILLKNKSATVQQITTAEDSAALTEVQAFWDKFALQFGGA
jgi:hypothetical protein